MTTLPLLNRHAFEHCRNIANGDVFVIASGASAKEFPIQDFAEVPMIAMNGSISMFSGTKINPFFYVSSDRDFSNQQPELFSIALSRSSRVALWPDQLDKFAPLIAGEAYSLKKAEQSPRRDLIGKYGFSLPKVIASLLSKRARTIGFSEDMSQGFFDARTVAYIAIQIAYHAGFRRVFLVGVDLTPSVDRFYEKPGMYKSPCSLDDYYDTRILPSLKLLNGLKAKRGFEVYNLSQSSRIPSTVISKIGLERARNLIYADYNVSLNTA
ncbi:lipopolysaccharide biosynthesis protein [Pseudomonas aeruginosa]